jgi:hypothetical protein
MPHLIRNGNRPTNKKAVSLKLTALYFLIKLIFTMSVLITEVPKWLVPESHP